MATTNTKVTEESRLRQEIAKAKKEYNDIKKRNKLFGVDLDTEEANAKSKFEKLEKDLKDFQSSRQETLTKTSSKTKTENKVKRLNKEIGFENKRLQSFTDPERPVGLFVPGVKESNIEKLEKKIFEKEQEVKKLGGDLVHEVRYNLYQPAIRKAQDPVFQETSTQDPMADLYGGAPARQGALRGRQTPGSSMLGGSNLYNTLQVNAELDNNQPTGIFTYAGKDSLLLARTTGDVSAPIDAERFRNVTLYNLPPEEVAKYQRSFKLKETGVMDGVLADKIFERAKAASRENFFRLNPEVQDKTQISWEDATSGKALSQGAGSGRGAGPSAEQIKAYTRSIKIKSNELGVDLDDATLKNIVNSFARGEIASENLDEVIVRRGTIDFTQPLKGTVAEQMAALKQSAAAYGIQYNDDWYRTSVLNILKGNSDVETYNQQIKDLAKSQYPTLAAQIDAGYTVQAIASPYISAMSQVLELNPGEITLYDDTIKRALTNINEQNQPTLKPLWQFEQDLRKDERWRYTKNAEEDLMGTGIKLLRNFGLVS
jgi:hypothetical protein